MSHLGPLNYPYVLVAVCYCCLAVLAVLEVRARSTTDGHSTARIHDFAQPAIAAIAAAMVVFTGIALWLGTVSGGTAAVYVAPLLVTSATYVVLGVRTEIPVVHRALDGSIAVGLVALAVFVVILIGYLLAFTLWAGFAVLGTFAAPAVGVSAPAVALVWVHRLEYNGRRSGRILLAVVLGGLLAVPIAGLAYPEVPVGSTHAEYPDRPSTLTNESVETYVEAYEETRIHRGPDASWGCERAIVNRTIVAAVLHWGDDPPPDHATDEGHLSDELAALPASPDRYYVAVRCHRDEPSLPLMELSGPPPFMAVYFVNGSVTRRLGEGEWAGPWPPGGDAASIEAPVTHRRPSFSTTRARSSIVATTIKSGGPPLPDGRLPGLPNQADTRNVLDPTGVTRYA